MLRILVSIIGFVLGFLLSVIALEEVDDFKKYLSWLRRGSLIGLYIILPYTYFVYKENYMVSIFLIISAFTLYLEFYKKKVSSWYLHLLLIIPAYLILKHVEPAVIYSQIFSMLLLLYMLALGYLSHLEFFGIGKKVIKNKN